MCYNSGMKVALFVPCYVRTLAPHIIDTSIQVLHYFGIDVHVCNYQQCCGQPLINSGIETNLAHSLVQECSLYEYIVIPSSSCTTNIKNQTDAKNIYELSQFLYEVLGLRGICKKCPQKLALHISCHALRELGLSSASELAIEEYNKIEELLGCKLDKPNRDECCGFGGVYSLKEGFLSYVMGRDKLDDLLSLVPRAIVGVDMSCLVHLESIAKKDGDSVEFKHISQIILECLGETL